MKLLIAYSAVVFAAAGCSSVQYADPLGRVPASARPAVADSNSTYDYYALGQTLITTDARAAADAFYWAQRLDPTWADPLYARRLALLAAEPTWLEKYISGDRNLLRSRGVLRLDSLYLKALERNPFLQPRLDAAVYRALIVRNVQRQGDWAQNARDRQEVERAVDDYLERAPFAVGAWLAFSESRLPAAAALYERALAQAKKPNSEMHADLARVWFGLARYDRASDQMQQALEAVRKRDDNRLVRLYESRALYETAIGLIEEARDDLAAAREAYARALQEDLSYYPAHIRLGEVALALGDTMAAISQLALAAEVAPRDGVVRYRYARLLAESRQPAAAERELRVTVDLEPHFAEPYRLLGEVLEEQGDHSTAVLAYRAFLSRAPRDHAERGAVEQRIRLLGNSLPERPR